MLCLEILLHKQTESFPLQQADSPTFNRAATEEEAPLLEEEEEEEEMEENREEVRVSSPSSRDDYEPIV